jgi:hypothetical protein
MKSKIKLHGIFKLDIYKKGVLAESIVEKNLIVDAGFNLVQLLLSAASADKHITQIAVGELVTGEPVDPAADWTEIPDQALAKGFDTVTFPTNRAVSFNWSIQGDEANGIDISYFGLLSEDDVLFAAKSRPPIAKTADIILQGTWIINY